MFREGFGRHHRDFPALGLFSKTYFPSVLFIHLLHFLLRAQLKISDVVPEAEIFSCWFAISQRLGDTTGDRSGSPVSVKPGLHQTLALLVPRYDNQ